MLQNGFDVKLMSDIIDLPINGIEKLELDFNSFIPE